MSAFTDDEDRKKWVEKYHQLSFSEKSNETDIKEAELEIDKKLDDLSCLYRYRNTAAISRIIDSFILEIEPNIWLGSPNNFNDPFDCWFPPPFDEFPKSFRSELSKRLYENICRHFSLTDSLKNECWNECEALINIKSTKEMAKKQLEIINKYTNGSDSNFDVLINQIEAMLQSNYTNYLQLFRLSQGVACFSEVNNSILMWSHYAESHKGILLGYDVSNKNRKSKEDNYPLNHIYPVMYLDDLSDNLAFLRDNTSRHAKHNLKFRSNLVKSRCWDYEKEWRIIYQFPVKNPSDNMRLFPLMPTCIYLGALIDKKSEILLRKIAIHWGIVVKKMKMADNGTELIVGD